MGNKEIDELTILADKYECDKGSLKHNYTKIYNDYFKQIKNRKFNILEIGFGTGASVKMWLDYFNKAILYCIDIRKNLPDEELLNKYVNNGRLKFISADQSSLEPVIKLIKNKKFRIIIDDGSHITEDQQYSIGRLFPYLSESGLYIIEDLNCKRGHNKKFKIETVKMIKILKKYNKTNIFYSKILPKNQLEYINNNIGKVDIYNDKISFIRKIK